jgi:hypothetical protein
MFGSRASSSKFVTTRNAAASGTALDAMIGGHGSTLPIATSNSSFAAPVPRGFDVTPLTAYFSRCLTQSFGRALHQHELLVRRIGELPNHFFTRLLLLTEVLGGFDHPSHGRLLDLWR